MSRALIKTTSSITANLEADRIDEEGEMIKIYNGKNLVGLFDVGTVQFAYLTSKARVLQEGINNVCQH